MPGTAGSVRQVLVGAARHDAITSIALDVERLLRPGRVCGTYSWFEPDPSVRGEVAHVDEMDEGSPDDVIVFHLSYGIEEMTEWLLARPERIVIWYHNVTPHSFYVDVDGAFARGLQHGREQLALFMGRCNAAVADSSFNADEMQECGYHPVLVASPSLVVDRLADVTTDARMVGRAGTRFPGGFILFVSQVLPHKRPDHAIEVVHLLREHHGLEVGAVWAGPVRQPRYMAALEELMVRLGESHVWFTGAVSENELAALYRSCLCFASVSQHEGLSIPPLEAMALGAPVVVRGAAAVPETVGDGALVVPEDWSVAHMGEVLAEVYRNRRLRSEMRVAGRRHVEQLRGRTAFADAVALIGGMFR